MAWTVTVQEIRRQQGVMTVVLRATDRGVTRDKALKTRTASDEWIRREARTFVAELTSQDAVTLTASATVDTTPPTPPEPTAEEIARREFFTAYGKLQRLKEAVAAGVTNAADDVTAAEAEVRQRYLAEYFES